MQHQPFAPHTNMEVVAACERQMQGDRTALAKLGFPEPKTMLDVWKILDQALNAMPEAERQQLARADERQLEYVRGLRNATVGNGRAIPSPHLAHLKGPA